MGERNVEILSTVDIPSREPDRVGKIDVLVTYRLTPYTTGMVLIHKEEFAEETMLKAVKEDIDKKSAFVGKTYKV